MQAFFDTLNDDSTQQFCGLGPGLGGFVSWDQGVTKRYRLSWLTNSALVCKPEPECGGWGELRHGGSFSQWVQLYGTHGVQINLGDLTPDLTYAWGLLITSFVMYHWPEYCVEWHSWGTLHILHRDISLGPAHWLCRACIPKHPSAKSLCSHLQHNDNKEWKKPNLWHRIHWEMSKTACLLKWLV